MEIRAIDSERKSSALSVYLCFSSAHPAFFLAPQTEILEDRGATAAREQDLISNTAKAARPTRFESVIELPEV